MSGRVIRRMSFVHSRRFVVAMGSLALFVAPAMAAFNPADFSHHEEVTIESGQAVLQLYSVGVKINTAALFAAGLMQADGDDLVVAWDNTGTGTWVEVHAHIRPATNQTLDTSTTTQIWWAVQEPVGINSYPYANRYRIYSGNPAAVLTDRLRLGKNVYLFFDDFGGTGLNTNVWYFNPNYSQCITVSGGAVHLDGTQYPTNVSQQWFGKPTRLVTETPAGVRTFTTSYTRPFAMESRFQTQDLSDDARPVNYLMFAPPSPSSPSVLDEYPLFVAESGAKGGGALPSDNLRLGKVLDTVGDPVANSAFVASTFTWYDAKATVWPVSLTPGMENVLMSLYLDDTLLDDSSDAPTNPYDASRTQGAIGITCDPGTKMDVDWTLVRDYVPNEPAPLIDPVITLFASQSGSGTTLTWTTTSVGVTFDALRGDVSGLSEGGGAVHFGPTTCVEDDSADLTTAPGNLDATNPAVGSAFFYVVRAKTPGGGVAPYGYSSLNSLRQDMTGPGCPL